LSQPFKSGFVAIVGKPNVGKSTLMNAIVGEKVAIVSPKPQTTRKRIRGIKSLPNAQIVFVDTPGLHKPLHKLGERMQAEALEALRGVDVVLMVVDIKPPSVAESRIIHMLSDLKTPVLLAINKIDRIRKPNLLPLIESYHKLYPFRDIIPISATRAEGIEDLMACLLNHLPEGPKYYDEDLVTDQYERFMVSEIIREKILQNTEEEVPHCTAVDITLWKVRDDGLLNINADILVEREGQKGIIIGKGGMLLKKIGAEARLDIERLTGRRVFLGLWIKVKKDWRDNEQVIKELGY